MTEPIAAISTAPGPAALAVVRMSGNGVLDFLMKLAPGLGSPPPPRRSTLSAIRHPENGEILDRVLVTVFQAPESYTGEDMVELSCHGGWLAPRLVLEVCLLVGAREAEPGEFTRRAYLNGKMDLIQVEAVLDLVESKSRALHRAALHQLERGLSARLGELRASLVELAATLVHHIDFPEEDAPPTALETIAREADKLTAALDRILRGAPEGELLREGALTVLAGPPNSGKSSLFNALLGQERAIVTEVPGTTRDALEAVVSLGGFPFRLIDTAGLRATEEQVERLGIEVARRYLDRADVVLFCLEAGAPLGKEVSSFLEDLGETPVLMIRTKGDLFREAAPDEGREEHGTVTLSVVTGEGLDALRTALPGLVYADIVRSGFDVPVLTRARQSRGVRMARDEVAAFASALREGVPPEVASAHLRPAETALEDLLGVITREEVLDELFSNFCIGK